MKCQGKEKGQFKEEGPNVTGGQGSFRTQMYDLVLKKEVSHSTKLLGKIVRMSGDIDIVMRVGG